MAYTTVYKDIVFVEGMQEGAQYGERVQCDLSFVLGAQLKSLRDVKEDLATQAKAKGYNAVLDFTYGQKSRWLAIDDVAFWGKGVLSNISEEDYKRICEEKR
ncbi:hypothetical protein [Clostridium polynesiense]|uniref:hypothetical protein n=1 Tax=Clostridium polynesiense TaxID=1325933 RepID=UPI00058EE511|nr:hypothetical protein [Clostridium polynesiense]